MPNYNQFRSLMINDYPEYDEVLEGRGVDSIKQHVTKTFPTDFKNKQYSVMTHTWKHGDKLYKLAHQYYGDIQYWWIIALWNGRSTDADYYYGLEVQIPMPLNEIYRDLT